MTRKYTHASAKATAAKIILFALFALLDGAGASRVIWSIVRDRLRARRTARRYAGDDAEYKTFGVVLSRLKKDGLVATGGWGVCRITPKGRRAVQAWKDAEKKTIRREEKGKPDTVVVFDVPEDWRKKREYLRCNLIALGFRLLQKSVWIGRGPLPQDFMEYIRIAGLMPHVHIFGIRKAGTISDAV